MRFSSQQLLSQLSSLKPQQALWVGYSGGLDSSCLLHALAVLHQQRQLSNPVFAVHVHHGLSNNADQWFEHCQQQATALNIPFSGLHVDATPATGESPESSAREARYQAIAEKMAVGDILLTAHHQDDQAETLLIQLLRGSGVKGLAAMPNQVPFAKGELWRPLLNVSRAELEQYAEQYQLDWVEDESNQCDDFDRNFLRNQVIPLIQQRWPSCNRTLSRSASHCAEATLLIDQQADQDLTDIRCEQPDQLPVEALRALTPPRQRNLLRHWIRRQGRPLPSSQQLAQITECLLIAKKDGLPCVKWPGAELRRFSDALYLMAPLSEHDPTQVIAWPAEASDLTIHSLTQTLGRKELGLQEYGALEVRFRQGGESIQLPNNHHHTSLKKLFQQRGIAPWLRNRLPLIYANGELVFIVGVS